ncbi:AAA family ATPase [Streptomyces sp. NPDC006285]|uniref:AAA family ATPase n=1 Tax=Streptomyces sp. NPDC006285 TaxID=3364742 RepID=UPI00368EA0BA
MTAPSETPWPFHGGTAGSLDRTAGQPVGHDRELSEVHRLLGDPGGARLVLVRGERGAGRTAFVHAAGERLRADGASVLTLDCVPGDETRPLLLALRLVRALEEHRPAAPRQRSAMPATEALRAAEQGDGAAMAGLLRAALTRSVTAPVLVVLDDIQHADTGSLAVLGRIDFAQLPPTARLLASVAGRGGSGAGARAERPVWQHVTRWAGAQGVHTLVLSPLGPEGTTAVMARRLWATPDTGLARRAHELTRGVPGAIDALLSGWTRDGAIRVADGHAFVGVLTPTPVPADTDRFVAALDALSEPCRTVAGALSILWPLGARAAELIAASTGLSAAAVDEALRDLADAEIIEHLPALDEAAAPDGVADLDGAADPDGVAALGGGAGPGGGADLDGAADPDGLAALDGGASPGGVAGPDGVAVPGTATDPAEVPAPDTAADPDGGAGPGGVAVPGTGTDPAEVPAPDTVAAPDGATTPADAAEPGDATDPDGATPDGAAGPPAPGIRGWRLRLPLTEHALRARLGPLERGRLSATAVEALWAAQDAADPAHAEPQSVDPIHVDPIHVDPIHVDPIHVDPIHVGPIHVDPIHVDPIRVGPIHVGPIHVDPIHVDPIHVGPIHVDPIRVGPIHVGPIHVDPIHVDPIHADPIRVGPIPAAPRNADPAHAGNPPSVALLDDADAVAYLADRVAEAGSLVDLDRAVTVLTAAAQQLHPDPEGRGVLRWCRAVCHLIERPADRVAALHRYAKAAYNAGDDRTARTIAESILRNPADVLDPSALQDIATLFTAATANDLDWRALSRLSTAQWWDELRLPALVTVTGRALALSQLERWHEALDLLAHTEPVWNTGPRSRALPAYFRAVAELALGRPDRFREALALTEAPYVDPGHVYALATSMFDELLSGRDLRAAEALLAAQGLTPEVLPPRSLFLWRHLQGRWDEALEPARWMLANNRTSTPAADSHLVPARIAAVLLGRGRLTSARRLVDSARGPAGGPLEYSLDAAESDILRTLGDLTGAEKTLRRGLEAADAQGHVAGTGELWASLAEVHAEEGRAGEAVACLERLGRIAERTGSGRTRLRYLLASARVQRRTGPGNGVGNGNDNGSGNGPGTATENLREAVELARSRDQPFETAVTLVAAVDAGAGPPALLHEAYDLFGTAGAALARFRTRAAMRTAGITVPGRKQATAENERLLATLIAEGLTNRQIATVLRLSEDAVANRLTRLFARTGLRSRTDVVTAVLTKHHAHRLT